MSYISLLYKHHTHKCKRMHPQAQEMNNKCLYNTSFDLSVETGVKKKWVISVCRFKCVDGFSHFQVCFSQSQSGSLV